MSWGWRPYVPVAQRRANAARHAARLQKKGEKVQPIRIEGRTIARTFWGKSWCDNLEVYSDFANRLPRGRTYVRNGSVVDLKIEKGQVRALVSGSQIYQVKVSIKAVAAPRWNAITRTCAGSIDSLMDLLQGRFADAVMEKLSSQESGLFPSPRDITFDCSCPDWAFMCKHVAAVLYGIGARLDEEPELLFTLRDADHLELVAKATAVDALDRALRDEGGRALDTDDLESVFGIDLDGTDEPKPESDAAGKTKRPRHKTTRQTAKTANTKKSATAKKKSPARRKAKTKSAKKTSRSAAAAQEARGGSPAGKESAKAAARKKTKATTRKAAEKAAKKKIATKKAAKKKAAKRR